MGSSTKLFIATTQHLFISLLPQGKTCLVTKRRGSQRLSPMFHSAFHWHATQLHPTLFYDRTPIPPFLSPQIPVNQGRESDPPPTSPTLLKDGLGNLSYSKGLLRHFFFTYKLGAKGMGLINRNLKGEPRAQGRTQIKSEINRGKVWSWKETDRLSHSDNVGWMPLKSHLYR